MQNENVIIFGTAQMHSKDRKLSDCKLKVSLFLEQPSYILKIESYQNANEFNKNQVNIMYVAMTTLKS